MIDQRRLVKHSFVKGMDNISAETALPRGPQGEYLTAREIVNADVDRNGVISRRLGPNADTKLALNNAHSLWSDGSRLFGVADGALMTFNVGTGTEPIQSVGVLAPVDPDARMYYTKVADQVYYSNGVNIGRIAADSSVRGVWAPTPEDTPTITVTTGGDLPPGVYHLAYTFVDAATGEESGSTAPEQVAIEHTTGDVTAPNSNTSVPLSALALTGLPQREGYSVNVYCSMQGGDTMYRQATVPYGTVDYTLTTASSRGRKLEQRLLADQMLPGTHLAVYRGRLLLAVGPVLYYSLAGSPGLLRLDTNFLMPSDEDITLIAPTEQGFFVGADRTYAVLDLEGGSPSLVVAHASRPLPGSLTYVKASKVGQNDAATPPGGVLPCWFSTSGHMIGTPGGKVLPLTEDAMAVGKYTSGASVYREINGVCSVVTSVRTQTGSDPLEAVDSTEVL